jgi:hypothetical protein
VLLIEGIVNKANNIMVVAKDFAGLILRPGQVFKGVVLAKEGQQYWLKVGDNLLPVRADKSLQVGEQIKLRVLDFKGEDLLVERIPLQLEEGAQNKNHVINNLIERYGFRGEKETAVIKEAVQKLPVEENTAVRYLLDPFLFLALLIPGEKKDELYHKIEISRYKGAMIKEDVWEVCFQLQLSVLKNIEIKIKMQGASLYAQIWADTLETENILLSRKKDLEKLCTKVEIIPYNEGPLIVENYEQNIDFMV